MDTKIKINVDENVEEVSAYSGVCQCGCNKPYTTAPFRVSAFKRWDSGVPIQNAIPELDAEDREFMITGIAPECWDRFINGLQEQK